MSTPDISANILILSPPEGAQILPADVVKTLRGIDFIGNSYPESDERDFHPGTKLMHHLTFLGCSPALALGEPGINGDQYCHIELLGPLQQPQLILGQNRKPMVCPHCHQRSRPHEIVAQQWHCPHCRQATPLSAINWRKSGGYGHFFIKVWGIFESEAVPGDALRKGLSSLSEGEPWRYFYYRGAPF
ncbi:MAG: hypothetical protein HQL48_00885 [Gammaproteobacteria bacterium]|nr:hypothetical protein [Gammaproteobacteria bacterium]